MVKWVSRVGGEDCRSEEGGVRFMILELSATTGKYSRRLVTFH